MPSTSFLEEIDRRVLVCDGAMGTELYAKGVFINRCFESLNLTQPSLVESVHADYLRAGADVIETNTFGASRVKLRAFGLSDKTGEINREGARLARRAAGDRAFVAGAIGPLGVRVEPWGKTGVDEAEQFFAEQAQALVDGGVDLFILETFRDLNEIGAAITAVRRVCALPIVAQMTTEEDGNSLDGTPPEQFAPQLLVLGAAVVGVNCSVGPAPMLESIDRLASVVGDARLSAMPNAGRPRDIEGRNIYLCSPEYMASYARRFIAAGVRLVGGCCGTTPEHIKQISAAVKRTAPAARVRNRDDIRVATVADAPHALPPVPRAGKSRLASTLAGGRFALSVELVPPRGLACEEAIDEAKALADRQVDVITILDAQRAGARVSPLALAVLVQQHAGVETLLQYTCRDKNLLGIQSDLLGAHAMGLRNLLGVTGDLRPLGEIPDATAVFDIDSIGLTNVLTRLNHGLDIAGQPIGAPTSYHVGVMVNPSAEDLDAEIRRFAYKVDAGAEFAVTRPVFDVASVERFLERTHGTRIPIIASIWPFDSLRHAEYMANEVPGTNVPASLVERLRAAQDEAEAEREGIRIARELATSLAPLVQGLHVAAPSGRPSVTLQLLDALATEARKH